jgi:hypothetical protein
VFLPFDDSTSSFFFEHVHLFYILSVLSVLLRFSNPYIKLSSSLPTSRSKVPELFNNEGCMLRHREALMSTTSSWRLGQAQGIDVVDSNHYE